MIKQCTVCGKEFDAEGTSKACSNECKILNKKKYHREYDKRYRENNRIILRAKKKTLYFKNKSKDFERVKIWRKNNSEKYRIINARFYNKHKDYYIKYHKEWNEKNKQDKESTLMFQALTLT